MPSPEELADFVIARAKDEPKLAERLQEASKLAPFADDLAWQALRKKFQAREDERLAIIARRLMKGEVVDQREIDFQRGYFKGIEDFLNAPDKVIATLEASARIAYEVAGEDPYIPE